MNHRLHNNSQQFIESALRGETTSIAKKFVPDGKPGDKLRFYSGDDCVAIAERLEAIVEAQKNDGGRFLVEFETHDGQCFAIMPRKVYQAETEGVCHVLLRTLYGEKIVKGTLAEVLVRLRGEQ